MRITKEKLKELIKEELQLALESSREVPLGFSPADRLPGAASELAAYSNWTKNPQFRPGTWNSNNVTILVVDMQGKPHVWIPKPDPNAPRRVSSEQAMASIQAAGFVEDVNLPVPYSNF